MALYPFYTAITHLKEFFDITLTDDEFETVGMHAWDKINTKITRTYRFTGQVVNGFLELPCNAEIIESVTTADEDYNKKNNVATDYFDSLETEAYIESYKSGTNALYTKGKLIRYEEGEGGLYIDREGAFVTVVYKGEVLDDKGLPSLNYKQIEAVATYCAYVYTNKKAMMTKDKSTFEIAMMLKNEWRRLCDDARTPIHLSQNEMNEILDAISSWDRKRYGISFKPLK